MLQRIINCYSKHGIFVQHFTDEVDAGRRYNFSKRVGREIGIFFFYLLESLFAVVRLKWQLLRYHAIEDNTTSPNVDLRTVTNFK
jgi:hypothetical protein